jgi:dihydroorotase-like cyclic amidohydrolase
VARRDRGADGDAAAGQSARETGKRIHVLHISTKQEIEYLRDHKDVASCEATPHHLTLARPNATSGSARWRR